MQLRVVSRGRVGVLAVGALSVLPLLWTGQSAQAAAPAAPAAEEKAVSAGVSVTPEAWAAGQARYGRNATAAQALEAYWTPARMKAAKHVEDDPAFVASVAAFDKRQQADLADVKKGKKARPATPTQHSAAPSGGDVSGQASVLAAANPNFAYSHPTARTSGKVFFSMAGGNFVCSGTVVNSEGKDSVWTAGHCVHGGSGGAWATNWTFVPSYDDDLADPRPYGTWTASGLWAMTSWTNSSDFSADMGVAIMLPRNGNKIVNYLGGQGIRTGIGKNVSENAFGYPAESPFDGGNLYRCAGTSSPEWSFLFWSSETIQIPCDMTRGSSGGGWLNGWDGNWGYLNGVNSRIDRIVAPTIMLSPYFDDTAWSLYGATRNL